METSGFAPPAGVATIRWRCSYCSIRYKMARSYYWMCSRLGVRGRHWISGTINVHHLAWWKKENNYSQILPNLSIADALIPQTAMGGEFRYLGHMFKFDIDNKPAKEILEQKLSSLLSVTTELEIKASIKLKILSLYIHIARLYLRSNPMTFRLLGLIRL